MDNNLPIMVFNMRQSENIVKAVCGDLSIGTLVTSGLSKSQEI
jgi:uridylate kinase